MLIYNVTIKVAENVHTDWINWLRNTHIPEVMATGCFTRFTLVRLLETDDTEGPTFAVQYFAESRAQYNRYISIHAPRLRQAAFDAWGNAFIAFRSLMEVIN